MNERADWNAYPIFAAMVPLAFGWHEVTLRDRAGSVKVRRVWGYQRALRIMHEHNSRIVG